MRDEKRRTNGIVREREENKKEKHVGVVGACRGRGALSNSQRTRSVDANAEHRLSTPCIYINKTRTRQYTRRRTRMRNEKKVSFFFFFLGTDENAYKKVHSVRQSVSSGPLAWTRSVHMHVTMEESKTAHAQKNNPPRRTTPHASLVEAAIGDATTSSVVPGT